MINREGTKKILKIIGIAIIVIIVLGYGLFTSHSFISGPKITIYEPINGSTISTSSVEIKGTAQRIQDVTLNGRAIFIDDKGNFNETILLAPGYNVSLFFAKDKFNRTTEYKLELVYKDK
jgi:hypothetical protein